MSENRQDIPLIFNIQKFSIHDGPGIRTTVFFKGCPLCCPWCHNPEGQSFQQEYMKAKDNNDYLVGQMYTIDTIIKRIEQDRIFYDKSKGGVTLSGGEVLAQNMKYVSVLAQCLYDRGITVGIDTCGYIPYCRFEQILPYVNFFLYDIKLFDRKKHIQYIGVDNSVILDNLCRLSRQKMMIYLRLIMIDGVNMDIQADIKPMLNWLEKNKILIKKIHLLPYHSMGKNKYDKVQCQSTVFQVPSIEQLINIQNICKERGYDTIVGG